MSTEATDGPEHAARAPAHKLVVATLIVGWVTVGDTIVGAGVLAAALFFDPIVVFLAALAVFTFVERLCCSWVDRNWDTWAAKAGDTMREKVARWREMKLMAKVVDWITSGSTRAYALAAILTSPTVVVTMTHLLTDQPAGRRRVWWACVAYAVSVAATLVLIVAIGKTVVDAF